MASLSAESGPPLLWESLQPMLPSRAAEPFNSPDWLFELKWGGVRALAFVQQGTVTLRGQNQRDLTDTYPELQPLAAQLKGDGAVLDGEIVGLGPQGYPDLELLRPRLNLLLKNGQKHFPRTSLSFQITDLLALEGELLLSRPLWQRKNLLHARFEPSPRAQVCDLIEGEGIAFYDAVCEHHLEGIVAKNKYSPYVPGKRTRHWLEIPAMEIGHFVIGGYTFGGGRKKEAFESILLGLYQGNDLVYVGRATAGLSTPEGWRTVRLLEELHAPSSPFANPPLVRRLIYWCKPTLVCQARVGERHPRGELRFAVFVSLRPDLAPKDCCVEPE